jgi:selenocysteine lyase/cysteine desulfurase
MCLTAWLLSNLLSLRHGTGVPLVQLYGPRDTRRRGATISFNILDPQGAIVDERVIEKQANAQNISLRTGGCLCNPGAHEAAHYLSRETLDGTGEGPRRGTREHCTHVLGLAGVVRVSLGVASNFADVYRFLEFARTFLDTEPDLRDLPPSKRC